MARQGRPEVPRRRWGCLARLVVAMVTLAFLAALAAVGGVVWLVTQHGRELPTIERVQDYQPRQVTRIHAANGEVIATLTDGEAQVRTVLTYDQMPAVMRAAMVAAEDAEFYNHKGLDYVGLARAVIKNLRRGQLRQGASTITQQLVKNLVLSPERTIRRKIQEAILAFQLEEHLTKDEILTIYLNEVFFGSRAYGVEEASRYYFGHGAADLTLPEAATLAGLVQSPNRYNPHFHPEAALNRRAYVLRQMWEKGHIDEDAYRAADAAPLTLDPNRGVGPWEGDFPYYVDAVRRELLDRLDPAVVFTGGLRVDTALDIDRQAIAEDAVQAGLRAYDARHGYHQPFATLDSDERVARWLREHADDIATRGLRADHPYRAVVVASDDARTVFAIGEHRFDLDRVPLTRLRPDDRPWGELYPVNSVFTVVSTATVPPDRLGADPPPTVRIAPSAEAALVAIDPATRHVVALVGGYDFAVSSFNRAIQAQRQVGSSFKPFVFAAALEQRRLTAATVLLDQPVTFPIPGQRTWQPQNYDGAFLGPMRVREALAKSRNVIAVRALDVVGLVAATDLTRRAGITSPLTDNLTLALGSAELPPVELTNGFTTFAAGGQSGQPVFVTRVTDRSGGTLHRADPGFDQTIDPALAWLMTSLMRSVVTEGTATSARALPFQVVGKTGTTNGARDAWFVGYSTALVTGVWVGRDDNVELGRGETGGQSALPIWIDFMRRAHENEPPADFGPPPAGIETRRIDATTGLLARGSNAAVDEHFLTGTAPTQLAPDDTARSATDVLLQGGAPTDAAVPGEIDDGF